jgi:ribosome maturation factor RimP
VKVILNDETIITGKLKTADDLHLVIMTKGEKKKGLNPEETHIDFDNIKETKVILSFK